MVPHKPDFDRLAFGTILAQDSPHLDRDQTRHAKQLEKLLCDEARATPPLPSAPYLPTYLRSLVSINFAVLRRRRRRRSVGARGFWDSATNRVFCHLPDVGVVA